MWGLPRMWRGKFIHGLIPLQTGFVSGKGLAQIITVIESDAKFQQVWIWNNRHCVVPDSAVKDNVSWEGELEDEVWVPGRAQAPLAPPRDDVHSQGWRGRAGGAGKGEVTLHRVCSLVGWVWCLH